MSHSKRNTSRAVFTSYERSLAKAAWGSNSARLSRDSFLPFASCSLCLLPARTPVSCSHGDIFCKECALENILAQKREIKRLQKLQKREEKDAEEEREREDAEAKQRFANEFEKIQMGLESKLTGSDIGPEYERQAGKKIARDYDISIAQGEKRKFKLDQEEILRISREETLKARKVIIDEKADKTTLPSFWVPSITPSSNMKNKLHHISKKTKITPICPASPPDKPHIYSLHTLIDVEFTEEENHILGCNQRICPTCKKVLNNTSKALLIRNCGHVICKNCVSNLVTKTNFCDPNASELDQNKMACFVCNADISGKSERFDKLQNQNPQENIKSGFIEIRCEGTGFASGGLSKVEKAGIAFQC